MNSKSARQCKICQKTIVGSTYKFNAHLYHHRAVPPRFKCTLCSREFFRNDEFKRHVERHTGSKKRQYYVCDYCDRGFVNKRNLIYHLANHDDGPLYKHKCIACGATYCEDRLLKYHIRKTHFNLNYAEPSHIKKKLNETWVETIKESPVCVEMTKVNNNVIKIKKYSTIKADNDSEPNIIDEKASFQDYINSALAENDKSQYSKATCDYCHKEMLKKSLLGHIRERHLKLRRFKCEECSRSFARHYQLVDHVCGGSPRRRRANVKKE